MQVVATWTGSTADAPRRALRITIEQYAAESGAVRRTVAGDSQYLQSIRKYIWEIVDIDNRFGAAELVGLSMKWF